jgi:hypothetical protein
MKINMTPPSPKEFYEDYKNNPTEASKAAREMGVKMGRELIQKNDVQPETLEGVATVLNEFQKEIQGEPCAKVQDGKVVMRYTDLCPFMREALAHNLPWEWLDVNFAWPMIEGLASSVHPDIKLKLLYARSRGDPECMYVFEVES